jgi:cytochrome c551
MRASALFLALLVLALFVAGCGGPEDSDQRLAEACERQREEVAEEEGDTPTAKSTEERLEEVTLVECAGQATKVVAADEEGAEGGEGEDADSKTEEGEGEGTDAEPTAEPDGSTDGEAPTKVALDPEARELFAGSCGSCHALSDAETTGAVGPGLDDTEMDAAAVAEQIENGGGAMPAGILEGEEATAVAEYVAAAAAAS